MSQRNNKHKSMKIQALIYLMYIPCQKESDNPAYKSTKKYKTALHDGIEICK